MLKKMKMDVPTPRRETPREFAERKLGEAARDVRKLPKGELRTELETELAYVERMLDITPILAGSQARRVVEAARRTSTNRAPTMSGPKPEALARKSERRQRDAALRKRMRGPSGGRGNRRGR